MAPVLEGGVCSCCKRLSVWQTKGAWSCWHCDDTNTTPWSCLKCVRGDIAGDLPKNLAKPPLVKKQSSKDKLKGIITNKLVSILKDPWEEHHLEQYPTERVNRHRYTSYGEKGGEWKVDELLVRFEPKSFAKGAMRACFRMKMITRDLPSLSIADVVKQKAEPSEEDWLHAQNYIAKQYMSASWEREPHFDDVVMQAEAIYYTDRFNENKPPKRADMFTTMVVEFIDRPDKPCYGCERFIEGEYVKYNSNAGFVENKKCRRTPQAFSHCTFRDSSGECMVVDVQGVGDMYTDPQIHTRTKRFGDGDLGASGIAMFFGTHQCNDICRLCKLSPFELSPNDKLRLKTSSALNACTSKGTIMSTRHLRNLTKIKRNSAMKILTEISLKTDTAETPKFSLKPDKIPEGLNKVQLSLSSLWEDSEAKNENNYAEVHLHMAKLHLDGYFTDKIPDDVSALWHLFRAAKRGSSRAILALARHYCKLGCEADSFLPTVTDHLKTDPNVGAKLWLAASDRGNTTAIFQIARFFKEGLSSLPGEPTETPTEAPDFGRSLALYNKLMKVCSEAAKEVAENPRSQAVNNLPFKKHELMKEMADLYKDGGKGVEKDVDTARDMYYDAVTAAMVAGDRFFSMKCQRLADRC